MYRESHSLNTVTVCGIIGDQPGNLEHDGAERKNEPKSKQPVSSGRTPNPLRCSLEQVLDEKNLELARTHIRKKTRKFANIKRRERALKQCDYWTPARIRQRIRSGQYSPKPYEMCKIPKPNGGERTLLLQDTFDRIVSQAVRQIIEPICEEHIFNDHSYAYRPKRSFTQALRNIEELRLKGYSAVKVDLSKFFDNIPHGMLLQDLQQLHPDPELEQLLKQIIKGASYRDPETGKITPIHLGIPQGGILSPLFANIYGERLDRPIRLLTDCYFRYADDIGIICHTTQEAEYLLGELKKAAEEAHLIINMEKTKCVPINELTIFNVGFSEQGMYIPSSTISRSLDELTSPTADGTQTTTQDKTLSFNGWLRHYQGIDPKILTHPETSNRLRKALDELQNKELADILWNTYQTKLDAVESQDPNLDDHKRDGSTQDSDNTDILDASTNSLLSEGNNVTERPTSTLIVLEPLTHQWQGLRLNYTSEGSHSITIVTYDRNHSYDAQTKMEKENLSNLCHTSQTGNDSNLTAPEEELHFLDLPLFK